MKKLIEVYAYILIVIYMEDFVLKMSEVFRALSDPTRLRIIRMLASNMESDLCVVDLAKKVGISQPALSQHIRILKNHGNLWCDWTISKLFHRQYILYIR